VVAPGKAALSAVQDGASVLGLFGYNLDAVIANRLLPEAVTDPFFDQSRAAQQAAMEDLIGIGISAPILEAKLQPERPQNPAALLQLATQVYGSEDPASFLVERVDHSVERTGDQYIVLVNAPFAKREELRLEEVDEGIAVHLNGRRCVIALPDVLYTEASSWSYDGEVLKVVLDR
jgi:arsenite-transporting ATPase